MRKWNKMNIKCYENDLKKKYNEINDEMIIIMN